MAWDHSVDGMIESIKSRIRIPEAQTTYTSTKIRRIIDEELERYVLPKILAVRENYFLYEEDVDIVSGTSEYKIPYRAIGGKVKSIKYVDSSDNEYMMHQISAEEVPYFQDSTPDVYYFYIKRNSVVLVPEPDSSGTLRWQYYLKPSAVIEKSDAARITAINTSTNTVTVSAIPSTWDTSETVDIVRGRGGFECLVMDKSVSIAGLNITFSSVLPANLAVGDYVCLATETPFPQIPADLHSYLTLRVCKVLLSGLGYDDEAALFQKEIKEAEAVFNTLLTPRDEGNPKKIINRRSTLMR